MRGKLTVCVAAALAAACGWSGCRRRPARPPDANRPAVRGSVEVEELPPRSEIVDIVTPTFPATQPASRPATRPASRPATRPASRPATQPVTRPAAATRASASQPVTRPSTKPATQPASRAAAGSATVTRAMRAAREALARQAFDRTAWEQVRSRLGKAATQASREADSAATRHLAAGDRALALGQYDTAVRCMYRAVDLNPTRTDSLRCLAVALVAAQRFDEAVPVYESILGPAPADRTARFNLALALGRVRNFRRCEIEYRKLLQADERFVQGWYNLATLYQAQGRLAEARRTWREVIRLAPQLPSAHSCLAEVLLDLGESAEAMRAYLEAAKLRPKQVTAWMNVAFAAREAGSYGHAVVALRRATGLAPNDADAWARLGEVLIELHRATEKRQFLLDAIGAWRESLKLDAAQGELREKLRRYESAVTPGATTSPAP